MAFGGLLSWFIVSFVGLVLFNRFSEDPTGEVSKSIRFTSGGVVLVIYLCALWYLVNK